MIQSIYIECNLTLQSPSVLAMLTKSQGQNFNEGLEARHTKKHKHKAGRPITGQTAAEDRDGDNEGEHQGEDGQDERQGGLRLFFNLRCLCSDFVFVFCLYLHHRDLWRRCCSSGGGADKGRLQAGILARC